MAVCFLTRANAKMCETNHIPRATAYYTTPFFAMLYYASFFAVLRLHAAYLAAI